MPKVTLPDGRVVNFPDSMSLSEIEAASASLSKASSHPATNRLGPVDVPPDVQAQLDNATQPGGQVGGGDQLLANIHSLADVVRGAGKELVNQGVRGGALLRKIPGVNAVANALPSVPVGNLDPTNTPQQLGQSALNLLEFIRGGKLAALPARLPLQAAAGAAVNTGLSQVQGAGPVGTTISATLGGLNPYVSAGLKTMATGTANKMESSLVKGSTADYAAGFKPGNVFKYDVGGTLDQTLQKTTAKIQDVSQQLRQVLQMTQTAPVDVGEAYTATVQKYLNNPQAARAADEVLNHVEFVLNKQGIPLTNGMLNLADANVAKQAVGDLGAWVSGQSGMVGDLKSNVIEDVANTFYDGLKKQIEARATGPVAGLNHQLSDLLPIRAAVIRRIPVADRANILSLTDVISLAAGRVPVGILGHTLRSGPAAAALAKMPATAAQIPGQLGSYGATTLSSSPQQ